MFVSSYSTYVNTNSSDRINKDKIDYKQYDKKSFESELSKKNPSSSLLTKNFPIDYVVNSKTFSNQYKLQDKVKSEDGEKFKKINDMKNAENSYTENSIIFSLLIKPHTPFKSAGIIDKKLPENIQKIVEDNLKRTMANTYIENDKYHKVTA